MRFTPEKKSANSRYWSASIIILLATLAIAWRSLSPGAAPDVAAPAAPPEAGAAPVIAAAPVTAAVARRSVSAVSSAAALANATTASAEHLQSDSEAINPDRVKEMVQELGFDEYGHLVISPDARRQLDHAISLIGYGRNSAELAQLTEAIHGALPGEAGKQVTDLLGLYYEYKLVEMDFAHSRDAASPGDAANDYQILSRMRQSYLGETLAKKLFAEEDQFMNYTHELMQLDSRESLSAAQRAAAEQQLKTKYYPTGEQ